MSTTTRVLVLLSPGLAAERSRVLRNTYRVLSALEPRLLVVDVEDNARKAIEDDPGVAGVFAQDVPDSVLVDLGPEEQLFVAAFLHQKTQPGKVRPGEGASWDAAGFQPPGKPRVPPS